MFKNLFSKNLKQFNGWQDRYGVLLSRFKTGKTVEDALSTGNWIQCLGCNPEFVIENMKSLSLIRPVNKSEAATVIFSLKKLRQLGKNEGLKISGRKIDIATRLIEKSESIFDKHIAGTQIWICTEEGLSLVQVYSVKKKKEHEQKLIHTARLIAEGDYQKACLLVKDVRLSEPFLAGLGIDWDEFGSSRDVEKLRLIMNCWPSLLNGVDKLLRKDISIAAATSSLWGSKAGVWLNPSIEIKGIHFSKDVAARMVKFHASNIRNISEAKRIFGNKFQVWIVDYIEGAFCDSCLNVRGHLYSPEELPELPLSDCKCLEGCMLHMQIKPMLS